MIIAIDGPAASGKGTLARQLAARLSARLSRHRHDLPRGGRQGPRCRRRAPADEATATAAAEALTAGDLTRPDLRSEAVGQAASKVAAMPRWVRDALLDFQRRFAQDRRSLQGAVLDGRDIGTVVCPEADVKILS